MDRSIACESLCYRVAGFVGPHLAAMLNAKGCEVTGLGFRIEKPVQGQDLPENVEVFRTAIRDYEGLRTILPETRPDHTYHLAAIAHVVSSFKDPRLTYDVNVGGTLNLFEALRELELRRPHCPREHCPRLSFNPN